MVDLTQRAVPLLTRDADGNPATRAVPGGVVDVEFVRDVRPILQRSCVACHTRSSANPPGNLVLDDLASYDGVPGDYARLADDVDARWGYPPIASWDGNRGTWRQTNASRYVRRFQSRRSLLVWKVFGRRLDGWRNADHPTETVPGDPATFPAGADRNAADIDFTGTIMPPPGSGVPALTQDEKMTIARWIDLGAPINGGNGGTLAVGLVPRRGASDARAERAARGRERGAADAHPPRRRRRQLGNRAGHAVAHARTSPSPVAPRGRSSPTCCCRSATASTS